jgi:hypothetical protein
MPAAVPVPQREHADGTPSPGGRPDDRRCHDCDRHQLDRDTGVLYAATGEGMLHAFETVGADAGKELTEEGIGKARARISS